MTRVRPHVPGRILFVLIAGVALAGPAHSASQPKPKTESKQRTEAKRGATSVHDLADPLLLRGLEWRSIGPYRGGRVTAVTGVPGQPSVYYFGGTGSGIWKSLDGGQSWRPIADGQIGTGSVGAVAVAPSDPNVVYAGMGEGCIRGNVSHGDGVYKSVDAGRTWTHIGLDDTRQIGRIRIHPKNPDLVYVAALGHAFGPNRQRGVFRSNDGGTTWKNVLFVNDSTGAIDMAMDPQNPRILYATTWQVIRKPWTFESGGLGGGLYKSMDGGDSWKRILGPGLPKSIWGRVGVAISGANTDRVWAAIEAEDGGLFRSDDAGRTWTKVNEDRNLRQRAWYYTHIIADPKNPDVLYGLNVQFMRSKDGGRSFQPVGTPHGDNHDLWIDPDNPARMIESNDGGANVTADGGGTWTPLTNQPTAQFYHVITDDQFPYHLYGAQQDNSSVAIASRTNDAGIGAADWYAAGGCESGFLAPKPGAPGIDYAGCYDGYIGRYDHNLDQERNVSVYPDNPLGAGAEAMKYRFQWTFPIVISPHDPSTLYAGANILFRSTNEGQSWQPISPDLTHNDPAKLLASGGPITKDNTSVEYYCTIFAMAESKLEKGLLWTGSDDGLVHVSRDAGGHWSDVTPKDLPPWSLISQIDPSPHAPGTAYLAANRYRLDDFRAFAYVTNDYGKTWRKITNGLPENSVVRVVREDPVRKGLLFCGTETGIYYSIDDGGRWLPLRLAAPGTIDALKAAARRATTEAKPESAATMGDEEPRGLLPVVPVTDIVIHDDDLVISTQGRAFWILDAITALRELTPAVAAEPAHLFGPAPAYLFGGPQGGFGGGPAVGRNPPRGVIVDYLLGREASDRDEVTLEFLDMSGKSIRKFTSKPTPPEPDDAPAPPRVPARAGINRFVWDMRYPDATRFKGMILWGGGVIGPEVVPGRYQVRLTAFGKTQTQEFEVRHDPRVTTTAADYQKKFDFLMRVHDELSQTHEAIVTIRDVRDQVKGVSERAKPVTSDTTLTTAAKKLNDKLTKVEEALYQTKLKSSQDPLNYPIRLNNKLAVVGSAVDGVDAPPTDQAQAVYDDLTGKIDAELAKLKILLDGDLVEFNHMVSEQKVPAVVVKEKKGKKTVATPVP